MGEQKNFFNIYRNLGMTLKKFCQPCTRQMWPHVSVRMVTFGYLDAGSVHAYY